MLTLNCVIVGHSIVILLYGLSPYIVKKCLLNSNCSETDMVILLCLIEREVEIVLILF